MAEGALFDLAEKVLEQVGSLALQEIKLAYGVKAELENLKNTVSTIKAVLLDAEQKGTHNNQVKDWLRKLKDVFLDAVDLLNDFSSEDLQRKEMTGNKMTKEVRIFFSSSNQLAFSLKMGHRIKTIRKRLNVIAKEKDDFHFTQNSVEPQVMNRDPFVLEGAVFDLAEKVLEQVDSAALQEIKLAPGVKVELENLKSTVSAIQAVLLDAEKQGSHNNQVKDWLRKLKDVFLDAVDLLNDFSSEDLQRKEMTGNKVTKEVRIFFSRSNQLAFSLKMGHRMKTIRKRLNAIAKEKDNFHFIQNSVEPQVMNRDPFVLEGAVFDLAGKVLEVVDSAALQEIKLAPGVKAELENLKSTVSAIQAVLLDAEKKGSHNNEVKDWLKKLRDVFLDADDLLYDVSNEALQRKVMTGNKMTKEVRIFFSSSNQLAFSHKMSYRIKAIRKRLDVIAKEKDHFHFIRVRIEPQVMNRDRKTSPVILEEDVVGREDDKNEIIKLLLDANIEDNVSIIPIVGIGGLGKTTLAQLIYNDEIVKNNFELKLWICISDIFDLERIIKEILEQLTKSKHEESLGMLQNQLQENLNEKKYLLVLDDFWNEDGENWLLLKNLLMGGARGSSIVVTTRSIKVAEITGTTTPHALKGLAEEKAWSLFVKMAFEGGTEPENQGIIDLGKEIVGKCIGVPLAIRTIGSLLYGRTSEIRWKSFLDYELSKLSQQENNISLTLKLSYDHLPPNLKQCFAYCRLFPKDYRIDINTLINLWAAQGFIVLEGPRQRFVDIGKKYFMELLSRLFFQDVENDHLGNIRSCKMHDLMHDLAILVSGTESAILNSSGENVIENVHHVAFDLVNSSSQFSIPVANKRKIRTILAGSVGGKLGSLTCEALISNLNYLRTLDLSCLGLHEVPHSIGELSHLRYLDLSGNENVEFLPDSITKLLNLWTLKLSGCGSLKELPQRLKKLVNLRHLDITDCNELTHMPLGIGQLISLEILTVFVVRQEGSKASSCSWYKKKQAWSSGGLNELNKLSNLGGSLLIHSLGHGEDDIVECRATNMKEKQYLQNLRLRWKDREWDDGETKYYDEMSLQGLQPHPNLRALELQHYMGVKIPSWVSFLTNLVNFKLYENRRLQHLPPLNQLHFLKFVSLQYMYALEYIWIDEDSVSNVLGASSSSSSSKTPFFPSLSHLSIMFCPKLKGWWRNSVDDDDDNEPHHLLLPSFPPSLSELNIIKCPNLTSMPPFPYLKEVLSLRGRSWKVLEQTVKMKMGAATTSTYFPLSQLQKLRLKEINDFESLLEEGLRNLVSLRELYIQSCDGLVSLPWIGGLTSLQTLEIEGCYNLTSLPQEIRNLTSLEELRISECPNLMSLPQEIHNLTLLKEILISDCPLLEKR